MATRMKCHAMRASAMKRLPEPVYIGGPMSGMPGWNFPAFHEAARRLRAMGYQVVNPAELDEGDSVPVGGREWHEYIRRDLPHLARCRTLALLPGWRNSRGAALEASIAAALGMPVVCADDLLPVSETILEEAQRLIYGDRQDAYGHPLDDFARTGRIWGAILGIPDVPPEKVGLCMVGVKISRECNHPKRDNRTDGAGYFGTVDMVYEERDRRRTADERLRAAARDLLNG